jgi:hypothetical protein
MQPGRRPPPGRYAQESSRTVCYGNASRRKIMKSADYVYIVYVYEARRVK